MKIQKKAMGMMIAGTLILLSCSLAFAAPAVEENADLPLIDCQQTIHKILSYDYRYVPTSETSNVSKRIVKGYREEIIQSCYDSSGKKLSEQTIYESYNDKDFVNNFYDNRIILPLIEKANRNEQTGAQSLVHVPDGTNIKIRKEYSGEVGKLGRLAAVDIKEDYVEGYVGKYMNGIAGQTTSLNYFEYSSDGNISGYTQGMASSWYEGYINTYLENANYGWVYAFEESIISDIKYDGNGKIVSLVKTLTRDKNGNYTTAITTVERNIKYNNFGDRVYWEEIQYNNYPPKPPVVKRATSLTCDITQLDASCPGVRRISGKLFASTTERSDDFLFNGFSPLTNKKIIVTINSPADSNGMARYNVLTADTDVTGYYWVDFDTGNKPGEYKVHAEFTGDDEYLASSAEAGFEIHKEATKLVDVVYEEYTPDYPHIFENRYFYIMGRLVGERHPDGIANAKIKLKLSIYNSNWEYFRNPAEEVVVTTGESGHFIYKGSYYFQKIFKGGTAYFEGSENLGPCEAEIYPYPRKIIYPIGPIFLGPVLKPLPAGDFDFDPEAIEVPLPSTGLSDTIKFTPISAGIVAVNEQKEEPLAETHNEWFWFKK